MWVATLPTAGALELYDIQGPFPPSPAIVHPASSHVEIGIQWASLKKGSHTLRHLMYYVPVYCQ